MATKTLIISVIHGPGWGAETVFEEYLRSGPGQIMVSSPFDSRVAKTASDCGVDYIPWDTRKDCILENIRIASAISIPDGITRVHGWCLRSVESAWILGNRIKVPWTFGLHDSPLQPYHSFMRRRLIFAAANSAAGLVTVSKAMQESCEKMGLAKIPMVIPNGVRDLPAARFSSKRPGKEPIIGFLGMNAKHKGFELVKEWIRSTTCSWWLYGELAPVLSSEMHKLIIKYPERVRYLGRQDNQKLYQDLDLVVMPSQSFEAFGLVAVEAFRAGLPVVASDVGGLSEVVSHMKTGVLFNKSDVSGGLFAVELLLNNEALRKDMGKKARERYLSCFSAQVMSDRINAFMSQQFL